MYIHDIPQVKLNASPIANQKLGRKKKLLANNVQSDQDHNKHPYKDTFGYI